MEATPALTQGREADRIDERFMAPISGPAPASYADVRDGLIQLRRAIGQAMAVAGQLERGQALVPLQHCCAALDPAVAATDLVDLLLALDWRSQTASEVVHHDA
jgi:hypothetical protein